MTNEERIDWLCRLRADLNNGVIFTPWNNEFTEALTELLEQQPCEDAISREKAIKQCGFGMTSLLIADCLKRLPSVTPSYNSVKTELEQQTRWIPVSERSPEEFICDDGYVEPSDYVLVWGDHGNYGVSRYWGNRKTKTENPNSYKDWMDLDWVVQKPIAWMPLPQPYTESEEDK